MKEAKEAELHEHEASMWDGPVAAGKILSTTVGLTSKSALTTSLFDWIRTLLRLVGEGEQRQYWQEPERPLQ